MDFIIEISNIFKKLTMENIIDIGIGLAIIVIFKILSSSFAYIIVKMFKFKVKDKKKIKQNGFYKPLRTLFVLLGIYIAAISLNIPGNIFSVITKIFKICTILLVSKGFANLLILVLKLLINYVKNFIWMVQILLLISFVKLQNS